MVCVRTSCTVTSLLIAALFPDPLKFGVRDVWIFLGSWCHLGREMKGQVVVLTSHQCSRNLQFRRLALPSHPPNLPSPIPCTYTPSIPDSTYIINVSFLNEKSPSLHPWHLIGGVAGFLVFAPVGGVGRRKFTAPSTLRPDTLWLV
ncbi:hypothetical protein FB451DRAFT_1280054 [Mycena latifolia]|nr:hypothetical protein FB451DRAFT_1280054 [Mycena latifolia]